MVCGCIISIEVASGVEEPLLTLTDMASPPEALYPSRNKVLHSLGPSHKNEQQALCPYSPVRNCHLERSPVRYGLSASALSHGNTISRQSVACQDAFLPVQKALGCRGVIWQEEEDYHGGHNRSNTFDDLVCNRQLDMSQNIVVQNSQIATSILLGLRHRPYSR